MSPQNSWATGHSVPAIGCHNAGNAEPRGIGEAGGGRDRRGVVVISTEGVEDDRSVARKPEVTRSLRWAFRIPDSITDDVKSGILAVRSINFAFAILEAANDLSVHFCR
jgi:hypothetical protein